jgi:hypothetical protein
MGHSLFKADNDIFILYYKIFAYNMSNIAKHYRSSIGLTDIAEFCIF